MHPLAPRDRRPWRRQRCDGELWPLQGEHKRCWRVYWLRDAEGGQMRAVYAAVTGPSPAQTFVFLPGPSDALNPHPPRRTRPLARPRWLPSFAPRVYRTVEHCTRTPLTRAQTWWLIKPMSAKCVATAGLQACYQTLLPDTAPRRAPLPLPNHSASAGPWRAESGKPPASSVRSTCTQFARTHSARLSSRTTQPPRSKHAMLPLPRPGEHRDGSRSLPAPSFARLSNGATLSVLRMRPLRGSLSVWRPQQAYRKRGICNSQFCRCSPGPWSAAA